MAAHTGDPDLPIVQWDNPFRPTVQGHGAQWHDDEIGVGFVCLLDDVHDWGARELQAFDGETVRLQFRLMNYG